MTRLIAAAFLTPLAYGQAAGAPRFEVATIKPASAEEIQAGTSGCPTGHGRATCIDVTLKRCIIGFFHVGPAR